VSIPPDTSHPHSTRCFKARLYSVSVSQKNRSSSPVQLRKAARHKQHTRPPRPSPAWRHRTHTQSLAARAPHPWLLYAPIPGCSTVRASIHLAHRERGGTGAWGDLRLHPHQPCTLAGSGGLRLGLGVHWIVDVLQTSPCYKSVSNVPEVC
jgi:hypothetical protein